MIKHIVFFTPDSYYGTIRYFTEQFRRALESKNIRCEEINLLKSRLPDVITYLKRARPDYTFSFNPILPLSDGSQFCDLSMVSSAAIFSGKVLRGPSFFLWRRKLTALSIRKKTDALGSPCWGPASTSRRSARDGGKNMISIHAK